MLHFRFSAYDPDIVLHQFLQVALDLIGIFSPAPLKRRDCFLRDGVDLSVPSARTVDLAERVVFGEAGCELACSFSEHEKIGERITTEPVRTINASGTFPGRKQP